VYFEIWYEWREALPPQQWAAKWCCHVPMPRTPEDAGAVVGSLLRTKRPNAVHVRPYYQVGPAERATEDQGPALAPNIEVQHAKGKPRKGNQRKRL